jgi:hypothetical protein
VLASGRELFKKSDAARHNSLRLGTKLATARVSVGAATVLARVSGTIRAPPKKVLAVLCGYTTEYNNMLTPEDDRVEAFGVLERISARHVVLGAKYISPSPLRDRDYVVECCWEKKGEDYFLATRSTSHAAQPESDNYVRMGVGRAAKLKQVGANTKLEIVTTLSL